MTILATVFSSELVSDRIDIAPSAALLKAVYRGGADFR